MFWDYLSQNPESIHQVMILMGDRGIPKGEYHHPLSDPHFDLTDSVRMAIYARILWPHP